MHQSADDYEEYKNTRRFIDLSHSQLAVRWALDCLVWALLAVTAWIIVSPLWTPEPINAGDIAIHVRLATSARAALVDGQMPLYFANDLPVGLQPIFQYYSMPIYALPGLVSLLMGWSAYHALIAITWGYFLMAAIGTYRLARYLGCARWSAAIAGATYCSAPYLTVDLYGRGSFPELSSIAPMPWLVVYLLRRFESGGHGCFWRIVLVSAALILSHKILLPWLLIGGTAFCVLASAQSRSATVASRATRTLIPAVLGFGLVSMYWLEASLMLPSLYIDDTITISGAYLTQGFNIFAPFFLTLVNPESVLAFQLGLPIMLGVILAGLGVGRRDCRACFVLSSGYIAFMIAPDVVWQALPKVLLGIQFPYRLLSLADLFGAVGLGLGLEFVALRFVLEHLRTDSHRAVLLVIVMVLATLTYSFIQYRRVPPMVGVPPQAFEEGPLVEKRIFVTFVEFLQRPAGSGREVFLELMHRFHNLTNTTVGGADRFDVDRSSARIHDDAASVAIRAIAEGLYVLPVQYSRHLQVSARSPAGDEWTPPSYEVDGKLGVLLSPGVVEITARRFPDWRPVVVSLTCGVLLLAVALRQVLTAYPSANRWMGSRTSS